MANDADLSLRHLLGRLRLTEQRVRRAVERRRALDPSPDDPLRGLYLTDEHLDWVLRSSADERVVATSADDLHALGEVEAQADHAERDGVRIRLRDLAASFGLAPFDVELLLTTIAPDIDARFERMYGYLNDDVSRRRASVGLALELAGAAGADASARSRLAAGAPLVDRHLVEVEGRSDPFLTRIVRAPDRVTAWLLGDDTLDAMLLGVVNESGAGGGDGAVLARLLDGPALVYLLEEGGSAARSMAEDALRRRDRSALMLDLVLVAERADPEAVVHAATREALLAAAGVVAGPVEALAESSPVALRALVAAPCPVILIGRKTWDPTWSPRVPALASAPALGREARAALWATVSGAGEVGEAVHFQLTPDAVRRSVEAAELAAVLGGRTPSSADYLAGARSQNASGLERHARRVTPSVGWDDLVLRAVVRAQLEELASRALNRDLVLGEWGMRPGGGRGRGVTALFAGDPGTGKTMAAEVVAGSLGLDLYAVDLSSVVDKYIGETEKHLEQIFSEAEGVNGVILFDEADALFGKRSEVSDAHDRHANIEVAYLLQRMERFDGLAILATNLRNNLDEAFARRLDAIVEFPMPDAAERLALWERCLGDGVPRGTDVDVAVFASSFELSGGNIRSIALTAAYFAAQTRREIDTHLLMRAVEREYRKLGRLVLASEFGEWSAVLNG
ncbi:MAG TPA: ATP-binding protein [Acidimicrobiales bacterium]